MNNILVTPRSLTKTGHPALELFREKGFALKFCTAGQQPDEAELMRLLPDCVGYLAGVETISAAVLQSATMLKVIGRNGVGIDNIDLDAASRLNIKICPAIGSNSRGVAELAISLMLSLIRSIPFSDAQLKQAAWTRRNGIEISGRMLGLVGCGHIGKYVANMALGLGMRVIAYDPFKDESFRPSPDFKYVDLETIFKQSDVISLHCPASKDGPLIGSEQLAKMKKGVYIINTARASLLSRQDVLNALESGIIAGLAIDVFEKEPPDKEDVLVKHDKVIATPHIGGFTQESVGRAVELAVKDMLKVLCG